MYKRQDLCSQLLDSAEVYNDAILHREAERQLAFSSFYAGEYDRSISIYRKLYEEEPDNRETRAMLGKSYLAIGRLDSAGMLMTASDSNASVAEMTLRYGVFKQRGELAKALTSLEAVLRTSDRELSESLDQAFLQTLVDYYKAKEDVRVLELHTARLTRTIVIVIAIVIGLVLVIAILILYRRIRRARERHAIEIAALNDEISRHVSIIQQRQDRLFNLASSKFAAVDRLCQVYYENQVCKNLSEKLSEAMDGLIELFSDEESMITELGELLDQAYDSVFSRFVSDFPKVKKEDKLIFIFAAFHVSAGAASLYLKKNKKEYVYNHRKRLKAKIAESDSQYKAEYLAMLG